MDQTAQSSSYPPPAAPSPPLVRVDSVVSCLKPTFFRPSSSSGSWFASGSGSFSASRTHIARNQLCECDIAALTPPLALDEIDEHGENITAVHTPNILTTAPTTLDSPPHTPPRHTTAELNNNHHLPPPPPAHTQSSNTTTTTRTLDPRISIITTTHPSPSPCSNPHYNTNANTDANLHPIDAHLVSLILHLHDGCQYDWTAIAEPLGRRWGVRTSSAVVLGVLQGCGRVRRGVWWD
ncbi:hypothetical protein EJ05DRAFT_501442 [Pseudovirgaria hyperparasitica]|uniref:Uncharacterized protein n=1 Tax=Pseudovirgaria hyperparasitica TaxID=470096 RepID=A0A6A6W4P6_9PEZI|nr:uncharacterized protein EJ05DRAFT_501442 [Pseudovirgaria hyperparasitica]KAF2756890.1 hypothetical protein EJ05DRAFT_501442 [Pseudovirgaria hyperparasitica]